MPSEHTEAWVKSQPILQDEALGDIKLEVNDEFNEFLLRPSGYRLKQNSKNLKRKNQMT